MATSTGGSWQKKQKMKHYPKLNLANAPRTIVLANGAFPKNPLALALIDLWVQAEEGFELICCDGAVNKLQSYTPKYPDILIGDLDSVTPELKEQLKDKTLHVADQNTNDLTKAINYLSQELGRKSVLLLGAAGEREDHFLANISLLPSYANLLDELIMLTDEGVFYLIQEKSSFDVEIGQQISVFNFSLSPITLKGVHWELEESSLPELWCGTLNRADEELIWTTSTNPFLLYLANECKAINTI